MECESLPAAATLPATLHPAIAAQFTLRDMFSCALIAAWLCVAAWIYLIAGHGRFWSVRAAQARPRPQGVGTTAAASSVAVVIPARNEAEVIGRAIRSLLQESTATSGLRQLRIFVVDDNSSDGTAQAARAASAAFPRQAADKLSPGDPTPPNPVTVLAGSPLPPGWSGKLWALQQGIDAALRANPDFVLLTDADIEHAAGSLEKLMGIAKDGGYDLVSFMVKLHCDGLSGKLLVPAFVFFFFLLYPPEWVRDSRRRTAGAAGGCMLIRPPALERIGGIAAIRQEIIDDCALAREVKRSGGRVWLGLESVVPGHEGTRSLRAYGSFARIERMIARTAFNQVHHSAWLLLATVLGMLLLYVAPIALMASGSARFAFAGAFAYGVMTFTYMPMARFYRLNRVWALTLPFAGVFYTAATLHSAVKYWSGRGGQWKGRAQDAG